LVNRNFTTVKSELDGLMRKSKLAVLKGRKGIFFACFFLLRNNLFLFVVHSERQ
jgi:hypothetical protein